MNRTITVTGIEPAPLSLRHPLGIKLDLLVTMKQQNGAPATISTQPQFVLLPRSKGGVRPYDMEVVDAINGNTRVQIPGSDLADVSGYNIELYTREPNSVSGGPPVPVALAAKGALITQGAAYASDAPLSIINLPMVVGPPGPAGAPGAASTVPGPPGARGSMWFTSTGPPGVISGVQSGDMYLDETTGDVYRYANGVWTRGTF